MDLNNLIGTFSLIDLLFLIPLFFVGIVAAYTDIKYGKIFNKLIVFGMVYGVGLMLALTLYNSILLHQAGNYTYLSQTCFNTLCSLIIGYYLWNKNLWSAGDAKLFMVCALLLPLRFYSASYIKFFPAINLLINLFVPILAFLGVKAIIVFGREIILSIYRKEVSLKKLFADKIQIYQWASNLWSSLLIFFAISIAFQVLAKLFRGSAIAAMFLNPVLVFVFMMLSMRQIAKIAREKHWVRRVLYFTISAYVIYCVFGGQISNLFVMLKTTLIMWLLFNSLRQVLNFYIRTREVVITTLECLRPGDVLCAVEEELIYEKLSKDGKRVKLGVMQAEGLNLEQVELIKSVCCDTPHLRIKIYKTFSFAPYLLLAVIISIITRSSLIELLTR
jgi:Flp pilus assembly protein protease CpaA